VPLSSPASRITQVTVPNSAESSFKKARILALMASKSRSCEKLTESFLTSGVFHVFTIAPEIVTRHWVAGVADGRAFDGGRMVPPNLPPNEQPLFWVENAEAHCLSLGWSTWPYFLLSLGAAD